MLRGSLIVPNCEDWTRHGRGGSEETACSHHSIGLVRRFATVLACVRSMTVHTHFSGSILVLLLHCLGMHFASNCTRVCQHGCEGHPCEQKRQKDASHGRQSYSGAGSIQSTDLAGPPGRDVRQCLMWTLFAIRRLGSLRAPALAAFWSRNVRLATPFCILRHDCPLRAINSAEEWPASA